MGRYWLKYRGRALPLAEGETLFGRSVDAAVVLREPQVSRRHCVLRLQGDELLLEDLGSRNGTRVNGAPVQRLRALRHGDVLGIGRQTYEVVLADDEAGMPQLAAETERPPDPDEPTLADEGWADDGAGPPTLDLDASEKKV